MQTLSLPVLTGSQCIAPPNQVTYECDRCGLCCRNLIVEADWADVLREPRIAEQCPNRSASKTPLLGRCWILFSEAKDGACPFLGDDHACAIYATRPITCVAFVAGSRKCLELRARAGLLPLQPTDVCSLDVADRISAALIDEECDQPG